MIFQRFQWDSRDTEDFREIPKILMRFQRDSRDSDNILKILLRFQRFRQDSRDSKDSGNIPKIPEMTYDTKTNSPLGIYRNLDPSSK